jgi:malate synthase
MSTMAGVEGLEITGPTGDRYDEVLTPRALELVALLHRELNGRARGDAFPSGRWDDARALFLEMAVADEYSDFLTLPAYERMP